MLDLCQWGCIFSVVKYYNLIEEFGQNCAFDFYFLFYHCIDLSYGNEYFFINIISSKNITWLNFTTLPMEHNYYYFRMMVILTGTLPLLLIHM